MIGPTNANARYIKAISSSTNDHVVTFNGTGGNSVKDSGKTIGVSIPAPNTSTDVGMSLVVQNDGSLAYGVPPGNYVTLDTQQDNISGQKTFTTPVIMSGGHDSSFYIIRNSRFNSTGYASNQSEGLLTLTNSESTPKPVLGLGIRQFGSPFERYLNLTVYNNDGSSYKQYNLVDYNGYLYSTTPALTENSTKVATTAWVKDTTVDSSTNLSKNGLVHNTGNETINGSKVFTEDIGVYKASESSLALKNTSVTRGTVPTGSNVRVGSLRFTDGSNATFGEIISVLNTDGSSQMTINTVKNASSRADVPVTITYPASGSAWMTAPYRTSNITTGDVLTAGNGVTLSTTQSISGQKSFINTGLVATTVPSANLFIHLDFGDKNSTRVGSLEEKFRTDGTQYLCLAWSPYKADRSGEIGWKYLGMDTDTSNNVFGSSPYRTSGLTNNDILTPGNGVTLGTTQTISGSKTFTATPIAPNYIMRNASLVQNGNSATGSMTLNFMGRNSANTADISRAYIQFYHIPGNDSASSTNLLYLRAYKDNCSDYTDLSLDAKNGIVSTNGTLSGASISIGGQQVMQYYNSASNVASIATWGTLTSANGYTHVAGVHSQGGEFKIASSSTSNGIVSAQLDGWFYQNEGRYRCLDTSDASGLSVNYANSAGSAGSVAWGNVSGKPAFVNNGTTTSVTPSNASSNGFYYVASNTNSLSGADANPLIQYHTGNNDFRIITSAHNASWLQQIATDFRTDHMYFRRKENGAWKDWCKIYTTADIVVRHAAENKDSTMGLRMCVLAGWFQRDGTEQTVTFSGLGAGVTFRDEPAIVVTPEGGTNPSDGWVLKSPSATGFTIKHDAGSATITWWHYLAVGYIW